MDFSDQQLVINGLQHLLKNSFALEGSKGCNFKIYSDFVDIEPPFNKYRLNDFLRKNHKVSLTPKPFKPCKKAFLRLWFSDNDNKVVDFNIVLKELSIIKKSPFCFLIIGNSKRITCEISAAKDDIVPLKNILMSKFPNMQIDEDSKSCFFHFANKDIIKDCTFELKDFVAPYPYFRNTINYDALKNSSTPLLSVYSALSSLPKDEVGFYQIIAQGTSNPWKENILNLIESEFESSRYGNMRQSLFPNSGLGVDDLRECKKKLIGPYFSVSLRVGAFCKKENIKGVLNSLSLAVSSCQYSSREFNYLSKADYLKVINENKIIEMFNSGYVRRPGMILTGSELAPLFNFGSKEVAGTNYPLDKAIGFKVSEQFLEDGGTTLGISEFAGKKTLIKQPERLRSLHLSAAGLSGKGKSFFLEGLIEQDIKKGHGVAVICPHGDLIQRLLHFIPQSRLDDLIYFSPYEKDHVICYNPFDMNPDEDIGKRLDDLIVSFRSLFPLNEWGGSIQSTLTSVFYTLLRGDNLSLSDARILLSKTNEGYKLREKLLPIIDNPEVRIFWEDLFERMSIATIQRVLNKLTLFLLPEKVSRIFSQKENRIDFRKVINGKNIFLASLPAGILGSDSTNLLGSVIINAFHDAILSRVDMSPNQRVPFNIYIDEFHRFHVKSLEDCFRSFRKYQGRMIVAYQSKESLSDSIKSALSNAGTKIVFDIDWKDSNATSKEMYSEIPVNDLMRKGSREGFVEMDGKIANFRTIKRPEVRGSTDHIKKGSIEKYYVPVVKPKPLKKNSKKTENKILYDEI